MTRISEPGAMLTLKDFGGKWRIDRRIEDFELGRFGTLNGIAEFSATARGVDYLETGELRMDRQAPMQATRRYLWAQAAGQIAVHFADGRHFHNFHPLRGKTSAVHHCADDIYRVIYTFTRWPEWKAEWRVQGPKKNYRMLTEYRRLQEA